LDSREGQPSLNIGNNLKFPPIGLEDTMTVVWPIGGKAGEHRLDLTVDPHFLIPEFTRDNNSQTLPVYVYSSTLTLSKPVNYQVIQTPTTYLQVNSSLNPSQSQIFYEFELDTSVLFNSPWLQSTSVPETPIVTRWQTPELINKTTYWWRCRTVTNNEIGTWVQSAFYVDFSTTDFEIRMNEPAHLSDSDLNNLEKSANGIRLQIRNHFIEVQSGGFADGNLARIYLDQQVVMEAGRGFNLAVIDSKNGRILSTAIFDTWSNSTAADSMALFIQTITENQYICVAIKDEGSRFFTENGKLALESIGSQYCRQIGSRDSWAIVGKKGALPGTVPESYKSTGTGLATVSQAFTSYVNSGTMVSSILGPAKKWYKFQWHEEIPLTNDPISHQIIAFNQTTSQWDTLTPVLSNASGVDLAFINPQDYGRLKILTSLTSLTGEFSPVLKSWRLFYEPVPDLATTSTMIKIEPDSAMHRQSVTIQADIYNVGLALADSFAVYFYAQPAKQERFLIQQPVLVRNLLPDSLIHVKMPAEANGNFDTMDIFVEIDPNDTVRELFNFNNSGKSSLYVFGDSSKPVVKITFDGREIQEGDWVNSQPQIRIQIFDNSPAALIDTSQIRLFLNDRVVSYGGSSGQLTLIPNFETTGSNLKATILYRPDLEDGTHQLTLLVKDASQNLTYFQKNFSVATELKILDVLNYPNPFQLGTTFTYILTKAADNVKIYIYTLSGKLIRKIMNAPAQVGFNQYFWNGRDQEQDEIANGVYLYEVTAQQGQKKVSKISKIICMQ
ncbi:T9SS type A sorting domain-containing protein, partial [candidate division KSB1 bacterium]|nr:T9SS type A sorting domain-containing protein [candidate division KSB1 bacterium]